MRNLLPVEEVFSFVLKGEARKGANLTSFTLSKKNIGKCRSFDKLCSKCLSIMGGT
jgi:hypothetical protein